MITVITNVIAFDRSITFVNTFATRLRYARNLRGLTQKELARASGLSQGAIGNYETDSRRSPKDVFRLAEALDVAPAWLAMGTGPMEVQPAHHVADLPHSKAAWPLPGIDPERLWALTAQQREFLAKSLAGMIAAMESEK